MGAQTDRLRCEVFQNLILSPINTGFLRHAVATALTVYGIETKLASSGLISIPQMLQQPLPFTVLKHTNKNNSVDYDVRLQQPLPFTVLKPSMFPCVMNQIFFQLQQPLPFTVLKLLSS